MTDEQKLELLKSKFTQIIQASLKSDPSADTMFLAFFNAVKDNTDLFNQLLADDKTVREQQITAMQTQIAEHETKIAEADSLLTATPAKQPAI